MLEIGISGGTYDPIHNWHLVVGECATDQFSFSECLYIPNGDPVHKTDTLDKEKRFKMVELAVRSNPRFRASRIEIDRPGKSFMLDTVKEVRRHYGSAARLNLIIGLDNLKPNGIMTWHRVGELLAMVRLLVAPREHELACKDKIAALLPPATDFDVINCPTSTTASRDIRRWRREGRSIRYLVPEVVYDEIMSQGYYLA